MQSPVSSLYGGEVSGPPIFTKVSKHGCICRFETMMLWQILLFLEVFL